MLIVSGDLYQFFLQQIAPRVPDYDIRPEEGIYLASLLANRSQPQRGPTTLFDLYKTAVEQGGPIAANCYKEIGDRSLFLVGVFPKHLNRRRGTGERYYRNMGASAYASLSNMIKDERYQHLSDKFGTCVNLLRDTMKEVRWAESDAQNNLIGNWLVGEPDGKDINRIRNLKKKPFLL